RIEDTLDALVIFEACRQGVLPKLHRRLCAAAKLETRHTSWRSVFVFDEGEAKICRWTDGRIWSPSRICGNFLVYHELYRKLPEQKCRTAWDKANMRDGHGLKDKALQKKVEQDGLVVLGSRKGTFVLKKDGLIKKTICVKGVRLPPLDQLQNVPGAGGLSKTGGGGGRRGTNSAKSRVTGMSCTGTQHLVCYEQAGAMEGLYRPRDYVELREMSLSRTFITNQKFRDPVRVTPLPAGQKPFEPMDEYVNQTRVVEVRTPPKPTLPPTDPVARSTSTTRKGSGPVSRLRRKNGSDSKEAMILSHPYPTRGQDRNLRKFLETSQALESSGPKIRSASPLPAGVHQTNENYEDASETSRDNGGSGKPGGSPDSYDRENTQLHLDSLVKSQICELNNQEDDDIKEGPTSQIFRNSKHRKYYAQVEESDTMERTLGQARDQGRPPRRVDNDVTEGSSSNMSSPVTITNSISLSSSLSLSPVAVPQDGPGALYSDSENMDTEEVAQTLRRASTMAYFPPRQYSATANTVYSPTYHEYFGDAPENSIRTLLFESDPMSPSYRYLPLPNSAQDWRYSGDPAHGPPPNAPVAYPDEHRSYCSPPAPGDGDYHQWYSSYPPRPRGYFWERHAIFGEYPASFVPTYTMPPGKGNFGSSEDYSSSDMVASDSLERTPVQHEYQDDSPEGYGPHHNAEYQMTPQQVLQRQLQDRLQLHQVQEQERIEYQKRMRYESSGSDSGGNLHSNAISSASTTSEAGEPKCRDIFSGREDAETVGSWTTGMNFDEVKTGQKGIGAELVQEPRSDSNPIGNGSAQVIEWAEAEDNNETAIRQAAGPVYDKDMATTSDGQCPKRVPDWQTLPDSSKESGYSGHLIGRPQPWSSPFGPEFSSKRQRRSSGEYWTSVSFEYLESPPTVDNGARDRRETTSNRTASTGDDSWIPSRPIQIMSHVHINPRRRPSIAIESSQPAEDDTNVDPNEYLLYSLHQPATFEVVQEDTAAAHDEPPSAHLGSEEDPFFSDLRAHGIGGRSCLAVHASSSPMEPSSAAHEHYDEPHDGSVENQS
ncbi:hypothetical protein BG000_001019, partial [Podila horticola]